MKGGAVNREGLSSKHRHWKGLLDTERFDVASGLTLLYTLLSCHLNSSVELGPEYVWAALWHCPRLLGVLQSLSKEIPMLCNRFGFSRLHFKAGWAGRFLHPPVAIISKATPSPATGGKQLGNETSALSAICGTGQGREGALPGRGKGVNIIHPALRIVKALYEDLIQISTPLLCDAANSWVRFTD